MGMRTAAQTAKLAALLLATYTRDTDLSDSEFAAALSNSAFYYGIDEQSTLSAFNDLSADEFWGGSAPTSQPVKTVPWY
jgi:hypothetical protein